MSGIRRFAIFLSALFVCLPASADPMAKWQKANVQGFDKYWVVDNYGNTFTIWCNPQRKVNGTVISVRIDGHMPKPGKSVRIFIDNDVLAMPTGAGGYIQTDCPTCSDRFSYLWNKLRSATAISVNFPDSSRAGFFLNGARDVLPGQVCPTDFEKKRKLAKN